MTHPGLALHPPILLCPLELHGEFQWWVVNLQMEYDDSKAHVKEANLLVRTQRTSRNSPKALKNPQIHSSQPS